MKALFSLLLVFTPALATSTLAFAGYDYRWLIVATVLLAAAVYTSLCRRVFDVFSRRRLYDLASKDRHAELKVYVDKEEDYLSSLRSLDLLLRLGLVLTLTFGRVEAEAASLLDAPFGTTVLAALRLAGEMLLIFVVFLEVVPWVLARVRTESWLLRMLASVDRIHRMLGPFRMVFSAVVDSGVRILGGRIEEPSVDALEEEILSVAEEGERDGLLAARESDMLRSIVGFGGTRVSEVLTPRTEMVCLDIDDEFAKSLETAIECGHSRIPVFEGTKDNVVGILYVKDLLSVKRPLESVDLRKIVRKPHFVPVDKKIGDLLGEFKAQRFHIAMVQDDHGGIAGLVTIEDVIEEIVGDIADEFEPIDAALVRRIGPGLTEVDARVHVDELNEELGTSIPEAEGYETIGGFLFTQWGRIPRVGEECDYEDLRFRITAANDRRISRLVVRTPLGCETEAASESLAE